MPAASIAEGEHVKTMDACQKDTLASVRDSSVARSVCPMALPCSYPYPPPPLPPCINPCPVDATPMHPPPPMYAMRLPMQALAKDKSDKKLM